MTHGLQTGLHEQVFYGVVVLGINPVGAVFW
jgi:hypothetical protein